VFKAPISFGGLIAKINAAATGPERDQAYIHAEEFDILETQGRIDSLKSSQYMRENHPAY
jgi:hypothetical protein